MKNQEWIEFYFPKRYIFVFVALVGTTSMYAIRTSISVGIVAMVNQTAIWTERNSSSNSITGCPNFEYYNKTSRVDMEYKGEHYNWDIRAQSHILGSYFYGNIATQLIGGILAEKVGAKYVYGGGILLTAIVYLLTPLVARWGYTAVVVNRIIQGLGDVSRQF
nr:sialin-like [Parasteatoda tepidariorum]